MAEKKILTADLYDNVLTEKEGDFTAKPQITGSLKNVDIAQRIVNERTEYRLETITNILDLSDKKKVEAISEGKSLVDGVGQYMLNISGNTLLIKGTDPTVGVYFTPDGGGEAKKVDLIVTNTVSQIIISIPDLAAGQYALSVTTQSASGYKLVKEPRTYTFPILLTVEDNDKPDSI